MIYGEVFDVINTRLPISVKKTSNVLDRMKGLLFAKRLSANQALWIEPCNSIHTFFMSFPIDAVFIDGAGTVIKISENLQAWRVAGSLKSVAVIELLAGTAKALSIEVGHQYHWVQNDV